MTPQDLPVASIDAAVAGTDGLAEIPLAEHVDRFDAVHAALNDALSRIDTD
jgi:hypothetical protein